MFIQVQNTIYNINHIERVSIPFYAPEQIEIIGASSKSTIHDYKTAKKAKEAFEEIMQKLPKI